MSWTLCPYMIRATSPDRWGSYPRDQYLLSCQLPPPPQGCVRELWCHPFINSTLTFEAIKNVFTLLYKPVSCSSKNGVILITSTLRLSRMSRLPTNACLPMNRILMVISIDKQLFTPNTTERCSLPI